MQSTKYIIFIFFITILNSNINFSKELNNVNIYIQNRFRIIETNGIPSHEIPQIKYNKKLKVKQQKIVASIPLLPKESSKPIDIENFVFGITKTGILIDGTPIRYWLDKPALNWEYNYFFRKKEVDKYNGYLNKKGEYFYKGNPKSNNNRKQTLIGYAADGFPIYNNIILKNKKIKKLKSSYILKKGVRISGPNGKYSGQFKQDFIYVKNSGDLDRCNGRYGITKEYKKGTYYYVLTDNYPFIPVCFNGIPNKSFSFLKIQSQKPKKQFMRTSSY